jgi:hypothetical protein
MQQRRYFNLGFLLLHLLKFESVRSAPVLQGTMPGWIRPEPTYRTQFSSLPNYIGQVFQSSTHIYVILKCLVLVFTA